MGEQQVVTESSRCLHPEAVGKRWGDLVSDERKAELDELAACQNLWAAEPEATRGDSPISEMWVLLTGADVFWLSVRALAGPDASTAALDEAALQLRTPDPDDEPVNLSALHLEGASLGAVLKGTFITKAAFDKWRIEGGHLEASITLRGVHLEGATLHGAHLEEAFIAGAHLDNARLSEAHLEDTMITEASLEGSILFQAHLERAVLVSSHLEGVDLSGAHLEQTDLRECRFDSATTLKFALLDRTTRLGDIQWSGTGAVDLTQIDWARVPTLGEERGVGLHSTAHEHADAVRAYRQVAAQLRAQGMNEVADRFLYRAQTRQRWAHLSSLFHDWRRPWRWPGDLARYLGSLFLAVLAGYGYRPGRTLFWYVMTVLSFMGGYLIVTHGVPLFGLTEPSGTQPLHWYEALVLSVASFHGRGFFPQGISLGDPVAILAASEAVIGLFVEISFIATFTQRYFSGK